MSEAPQPIPGLGGAEINESVAHDAMNIERRLWPEEVRKEARTDAFPWPTLIFALLPGLCALSLLLAPLLLLGQQARQQVVFSTADGGLSAVRAGGGAAWTIRDADFGLNGEERTQLNDNLPVLGLPIWSPDGSTVVTTLMVEQAIRPALVQPFSGTTTLLSSMVAGGNQLVAPAGGWSPDGTHFAFLESDGRRVFVTLLNVEAGSRAMIPVESLSIDNRAGLSWSADSQQLLVTAGLDSNFPLTLQRIGRSGEVREFRPSDEAGMRADGVWSPDGRLVAYIVPDSRQLEEGRLAGALWLADEAAGWATVLVEKGINMAPVWDSADRNRIYFTRLLTETNSLALFRVNAGGTPLVQEIGQSSEALLDYPFDRQRFWPRAAAGGSVASGSFALSETPLPTVSPQGMTVNAVLRMLLNRSLPILGAPQWSPDGRRLASTSWDGDRIRPILYGANLRQQPGPATASEIQAAPTDGWSDDGQALALAEYTDGRTLLSIYLPADQRSIPFDFTLDHRAGIDWRPDSQDLLVTGYTEEAPTPRLLVVSLDGSVLELALNDGQSVHSDGAWSPDGQRIAYIAGDSYTSTQDMLVGNLWVALDGQSLQLSPHEALAPLWAPAGDVIYYTRPQWGRFDLYRVAADGSSPPEYVGPSSELMIRYPWDRSRLAHWSQDGRQLSFLGVEPAPPDAYLAQAPTEESLGEIRSRLPVAGNGRWSNNHSYFVGTIINEGRVGVALYRSSGGPAILTPETDDWIVAPSDGWSPAGTHVALLRHDGAQAHLAVLDVVQASLSPPVLNVDLRAGMSWSSGGESLMVTAFDGEGLTPTLKILNIADNTVNDFEPDDRQSIHADAMWSPDGEQLVYVAPRSITATKEMDFLAGSLWLIGQFGMSPRPIVSEGLNFAPIWDMANERLLFTRYLTETEQFQLFEYDLTTEAVTHLGPSSAAFATFPFDRSQILNWSPEGWHWMLPHTTNDSPLMLYRAIQSEAGLAVEPLDTQCNSPEVFSTQWTPTNRALLVACPGGKMFLHWLDRERPDTTFPSGLFPTWQP